MTCDTSSSGCGLQKLESLSDDSVTEISENWNGFCSTSEALLKGSGDLSSRVVFVMRAKNICNHGLASLVEQHFLRCIEEILREMEQEGFGVILNLTEMLHHLKLIRIQYIHSILCHEYCTSNLKRRLEELSTIAAANSEDEDELGMDYKMDLDVKSKLPYKCGDMVSDINYKYALFSENNKLVKNIGMVVCNLRNIGFTSMAEDAYASAIVFLLKDKVHDLAGDDYRISVLESIKAWILIIIGSKDQLVNEYRVMLAEKLLNKSDYDIDAKIHTLQLLKVSGHISEFHFGGSSMQKSEIMLNDLIDSKRTNTNIKATIKHQPQPGTSMLALENLNATIISSNFWPPIQGGLCMSGGHHLCPSQKGKVKTENDSSKMSRGVEQVLTDYAKRYAGVKTPRKLIWKKNLGTVKLELQFKDRAMQFNVTPLHASIIMQFQDQKKWTSKNLAAAVGVPVDVLNRRIYFWISKGVLAESMGADSADHAFTLVEAMNDTGISGTTDGGCEELLAGEEDGERSVASVEDQLRKEMTVYEKFITGMLTNFGSMALDRIHNTLKMFCIGDPTYDKSLQQLQSFLSGLVTEEKLEFRDGMSFLRK
ncbi:hypothetical protein H5410_025472 [Solanum commersonii]|uniref:Anaphase-promoting complex subunit 2 n=1 Tax=Solanum commersonii TaxID=4109 RepID=A0A9J5YY21_SOLCO|nr:hypothetical protein H5410_025472 [Solanum commersonii]